MIDAQLADFLHHGASIVLGTRNERLEPSGARVTAVQAEDDGLHLVLYVPKVVAGTVLPDLESNGQAAVVFCRVTDDRALQIKGVFVEARPARPRDREWIHSQWARFMGNLEQVGFPGAGAQCWATWPSVAIRIRATELFEQTPGPRAGAVLPWK